MKLNVKGIDSIKVKCVIVALRAEMGDIPIASKRGIFSSSRSEETQRSLDLVRKLCREELLDVNVGEFCKDAPITLPQPQVGFFQHEPILSTAPPAVVDTAFQWRA